LDVNTAHELGSDPLQLFDTWLAEATRAEPNDPNAAALATAAPGGVPSVRMVLIKSVTPDHFCFFTNAESRKGRELEMNPRAALCFHWKSLRRQVRIEGAVHQLDAHVVDAYFHSRSRASQIGAAISEQSRVLKSREELEERMRRFAEVTPGEVPRPLHWRGFRVKPESIEFWIDGANRLHDRFLFSRTGETWETVRLFP
jgi:pyridoxamine 5'-phosphate oxidase